MTNAIQPKQETEASCDKTKKYTMQLLNSLSELLYKYDHYYVKVHCRIDKGLYDMTTSY